MYWFFTNPPKNKQIFHWTPKTLKLKVTKFLVKLSQFKFLVNTDKNIFVYKLLLPLFISDFSLIFMKKLHPSRKGEAHYVRAIGITYW